MQSYSLARTRTRSRMLSLRLGGKVVQSQNPQKLTPTQPESNTKVVYIKKDVSPASRSFQVGALLSQQNTYKKSNNY